MTDQTANPPPPIMWAQRAGIVLLTINLEDVKDPDIKFNKDSVYFKGVGGIEKKCYEITIPLYKEIDPENSKSFNKGRNIELILAKANSKEGFWPSLTSDKKKHHWLKCDFNKWQDEDDSGNEAGFGGPMGGDFEEMMRQMGGLGGAGGGGDKPNLDDLDDEEEDSDDEALPYLE